MKNTSLENVALDNNSNGGKAFLPHWNILTKTPEFIAILIALLAFILLIAEVFYLHLLRDGILFRHVWTILGVHISGGAALGVLQAAKHPDILILDNIVLNGLMAVFLVSSFGALFSLSCSGLFHIPCLRTFFQKAKNGAQNQKKTWIKLGIPGVFLFVLFPLTGTGPNIGFVLGKLMGLSFWTNLLTVFSACLTTVISFAFLGNSLFDKLGGKAVNHMMISFIAFLLASTLVAKFLAWNKKRKQSIAK